MTMNDTLKRRLIGLAVLLVLVFALSLLLPRNWPESGETGVPSATVPLAVNPGGADAANAPLAAQASQPSGQAAATPPAQAAGNASEPTPVSAIDSSAPPLPPAPAPKPAAAPAQPKPETSREAKPAPPKPAPAPPPVMPKPSVALAKPAPAPPPPVPAPKPVPPPSIAPKMVTSIQSPPPVAAAPPAAGRIWFVQIGSFADQGNAQTTLNLLQNIGYRGESQPINNAAGKTLYRVRLGPFTSEGAGQQALDKVTHQGYPQARLLSEEGAKH